MTEPPQSQPKKMPSFKALKTDSRIHPEVARCLHEYQNASRIDGIGEACGDIGEIGDIAFSPFRYDTV